MQVALADSRSQSWSLSASRIRSGLQPFASHISEDNERGAILFLRHDLKEIATDLARGAILAVDIQVVDLRQRVWDQNLLHMSGLRDLQLPLLLRALRGDEPAQQHHRDDKKRQNRGYRA